MSKRRKASSMTTTDLLKEMDAYFGIYQISFQFWGKGNNNVFIEKNGVDLYSYGALDKPRDIIIHALEWCRRVNPKK